MNAVRPLQIDGILRVSARITRPCSRDLAVVTVAGALLCGSVSCSTDKAQEGPADQASAGTSMSSASANADATTAQKFNAQRHVGWRHTCRLGSSDVGPNIDPVDVQSANISRLHAANADVERYSAAGQRPRCRSWARDRLWGHPLAGVAVGIGGERSETNERGEFAFGGIGSTYDVSLVARFSGEVVEVYGWHYEGPHTARPDLADVQGVDSARRQRDV